MLFISVSRYFQYFFNFLEVIENPKLKFALAIITGAPIIVTNDAMEVLPLVPEKTIQDLSK